MSVLVSFAAFILTGSAIMEAGRSGGAPFAAVQSTILPLTGFSSMAVDSAHFHLFVSSGQGSDEIAVTDFDGRIVTRIPDQQGATSLVLSADQQTLYAALSGDDAIAVINTRTLAQTARYSTGPGVAPLSLAAVGDEVWFGYGSAAGAGIGVLDLAGRTGTTPGAVTLHAEPAFSAAPLLAAAASAPDLLIAATANAQPALVQEFDTSSGAPVRTAQTASSSGCTTIHALAVTSDGRDVIVTCTASSQYYATSLALTGLARVRAYQTGPRAGALAIAPNGEIAVGVDGAGSGSVHLYAPGDSTATGTYEVNGSGVYGLAWSEHADMLFAVTTRLGGLAPTLNVIKPASQRS
ncbi:MAG TPA: hypothetical protein VGM10_23585 [Actinocrinis sp.]